MGRKYPWKRSNEFYRQLNIKNPEFPSLWHPEPLENFPFLFICPYTRRSARSRLMTSQLHQKAQVWYRFAFNNKRQSQFGLHYSLWMLKIIKKLPSCQTVWLLAARLLQVFFFFLLLFWIMTLNIVTSLLLFFNEKRGRSATSCLVVVVH